MYDLLGDTRRRYRVHTFLRFCVKIFQKNKCPETIKWACRKRAGRFLYGGIYCHRYVILQNRSINVNFH